MERDLYLKAIVEEAPRILGLLDRNPASPTCGCFDRPYWNYRVTDFASGRKQEALLTLALLYTIDDEGNPYKGSETLLGWIQSALEFWCGMQLKNGTFNDLYPNESAYVATAFSAYAVSETLLLLGDAVQKREEITGALERASRWLARHRQPEVLNQEAGAAAALLNVSHLTGKGTFAESARNKVHYILRRQSKEGWFREYGGADVGYLSVALYYLSRFNRKERLQELLPSLRRACAFLAHFVHPDGTFGGEYGSRNTEYLVPTAFETLAAEVPDAAAIAAALRASLRRRSSVSPCGLDDKYLLFYSYTYLQAFAEAPRELDGPPPLPFEKEVYASFPESGFRVWSTPRFYLVANVKKGGAFKLTFKEARKSLSDTGLLLETESGERLVSSWLTEENRVEEGEGFLVVRGKLMRPKLRRVTPLKFLLFHLFQLSLGRSERISLRLKELLRKLVIRSAAGSRVCFRRRIEITEKDVKILNEIEGAPPLSRLAFPTTLPVIYGESSSYAQPAHLDFAPAVLEGEALDLLRTERGYSLLRICSDGGEIHLSSG